MSRAIYDSSAMPSSGAMKATTVRFGTDLWRFLAGEADRAGVSVSQYIREAALARASAAAAARGEEPMALLAGQESPAIDGSPTRRTDEQVSDATALAAQTQQALRHAQAVTAKSDQAIRQVHARRARAREQA